MTSETDQIISSSEWVDTNRAVVDRNIFSSREIYEEELKQIFARAWNFMCHESQIPEPGSFFMNYIGEDQVVAVRDKQNQIHVLLNSCPHRGNTICRADDGKVRAFLCPYHGWNFDLDGSLKGMPGIKDFYRNDIDKSKWGMARAAQVDSYKGFVFATLDPDAPPLDEYLGWVGRLGIDMIAMRGEIEVVDGIQKNRLQCNWKLAADNVFDWYHPRISHGSALEIGVIPEEVLSPDQQMVMLGNYGHAISGPSLTVEQMAEIDQVFGGDNPPEIQNYLDYQVAYRAKQEVKEQMGQAGVRNMGHPHVFPNFWIATVGSQIGLRIPKGPQETELWWFTIVQRDMPKKARKSLLDLCTHMFGPAGLLEQDDGENWSHSTRGAIGEVVRRRPLNYSMGHGKDQVQTDDSGQSWIETVINEHGQRWLYESWQAWMKAESWEELMREHPSPPQEGAV